MQLDAMSSSDEVQSNNTEISNANEFGSPKKKSSKPAMEKRRRARINNSLNQLKSILLEALKKDSTRHSKLEKADILEMTVNYLKNVERQRLSMSLSIDPAVVDKYKAGFNECRNEVLRFLSTCEGVTVDVRTRLLSHLAACIRCIQSLQSSSNMLEESFFEPLSIPNSLLSNGNTQAISIQNLKINHALVATAGNENVTLPLKIHEQDHASSKSVNLSETSFARATTCDDPSTNTMSSSYTTRGMQKSFIYSPTSPISCSPQKSKMALTKHSHVSPQNDTIHETPFQGQYVSKSDHSSTKTLETTPQLKKTPSNQSYYIVPRLDSSFHSSFQPNVANDTHRDNVCLSPKQVTVSPGKSPECQENSYKVSTSFSADQIEDVSLFRRQTAPNSSQNETNLRPSLDLENHIRTNFSAPCLKRSRQNFEERDPQINVKRPCLSSPNNICDRRIMNEVAQDDSSLETCSSLGSDFNSNPTRSLVQQNCFYNSTQVETVSKRLQFDTLHHQRTCKESNNSPLFSDALSTSGTKQPGPWRPWSDENAFEKNV